MVLAEVLFDLERYNRVLAPIASQHTIIREHLKDVFEPIHFGDNRTQDR